MILLSENRLRLPLLIFSWLLLFVQRLSATEYYRLLRPAVRTIIQWAPVKAILQALNGVSPIRLTTPDLYIKISYVSMQQGLTLFIIWLYFKGDAYLLRLTIKILLAWFLGALLLNLFGKAIGSFEVLDAARRTIDLLFTPLSEIFLIPVLMLAKASKKSASAVFDNQDVTK